MLIFILLRNSPQILHWFAFRARGVIVQAELFLLALVVTSEGRILKWKILIVHQGSSESTLGSKALMHGGQQASRV